MAEPSGKILVFHGHGVPHRGPFLIDPEFVTQADVVVDRLLNFLCRPLLCEPRHPINDKRLRCPDAFDHDPDPLRLVTSKALSEKTVVWFIAEDEALSEQIFGSSPCTEIVCGLKVVAHVTNRLHCRPTWAVNAAWRARSEALDVNDGVTEETVEPSFQTDSTVFIEDGNLRGEIGRASCRERVCQNV